jgi:hypothetical protein
MWEWTSNYEARRVDGSVRQTERGDDSVAASFGGAEMDEENLIFVMVD